MKDFRNDDYVGDFLCGPGPVVSFARPEWPSVQCYHGSRLRNVDAAPVMAKWAEAYTKECDQPLTTIPLSYGKGAYAAAENFGFKRPTFSEFMRTIGGMS